MHIDGKTKWIQTCNKLKIEANHDEFLRLEKAYSESHRAYHTIQHLFECFHQLESNIETTFLSSIGLIEMAIWYHDAIYNPKSKNNEADSADWALKYLRSANLDESSCQLIYSLIMSTCHASPPTEPLHQLLVDIDISILATDETRFNEYEQQIQKEYEWVPTVLYKKKRIEVLNYFLNLNRIYNTNSFHLKYEQIARQNLKNSINQLNIDLCRR